MKADGYYAILLAAENGHTATIKHLETHLTEEEKKEAAKEEDYSAIRCAAVNGHTATIEYLETHLTEEEKKEAAKAGDYSAIQFATQSGHTATIEYLETHLTEEEKKEAAQADKYSAIRRAAEYGHTATIKHLETHLTEEEKKEAVKALGYSAIVYAAEYGNTATIKHLETHLTEEEKKEAVKALGYSAIVYAAENGHTATIKHLETHLTEEEKKEAAQADEYSAIRRAAEYGHTATIEHLETHLTEEEKKEAVKAGDYSAIRDAAENGYTSVINHLLQIDAALAYAEQHEYEYGEKYVHSFIEHELMKLQQAKAVFEDANPNGVYNIAEDRALHGFYMARNLIRRNDAALNESLFFLLNIPAIRLLAAREDNELLRLAQSEGNEQAAELLLAIPAVSEEAARHNYYADERLGALNLSRLAQDRESSMTALSEGEKKRLEKAIAHYTPVIQQAGVAHIMEDLRNTLERRYQQTPALLTTSDGVKISLPMDFEAFNQLGLSHEDREKALQAYFRHKDHSAWRYLAKPNPWMHLKAGYVYINEDRTERWSTFEEYQPLIAMLYLAATDSEIKATDGFDYDARLTHFIDELALIGRAHNWDKTREVIAADGRVVSEEYDDLKGDRPSCYSGVKRRLFQSVQGHPFFILLTQDILKQELDEFVRSEFKAKLGDVNKEALDEAWNKGIMYEERTEEDWQVLRAFDISEASQIKWLEHLAHKYGESLDIGFKHYLKVSLALNSESDNTSVHALKFAQQFEQVYMPKASAHVQFNLFNQAEEQKPDSEPSPGCAKLP